mgnify:CR=1 FL=1
MARQGKSTNDEVSFADVMLEKRCRKAQRKLLSEPFFKGLHIAFLKINTKKNLKRNLCVLNSIFYYLCHYNTLRQYFRYETTNFVAICNCSYFNKL